MLSFGVAREYLGYGVSDLIIVQVCLQSRSECPVIRSSGRLPRGKVYAGRELESYRRIPPWSHCFDMCSRTSTAALAFPSAAISIHADRRHVTVLRSIAREILEAIAV